MNANGVGAEFHRRSRAEVERLVSEYKQNGQGRKANNYTLKRWVELTQFLDHPIVELSTNWAENSMRPSANTWPTCCPVSPIAPSTRWIA
jgi:hypothetical protein